MTSIGFHQFPPTKIHLLPKNIIKMITLFTASQHLPNKIALTLVLTKFKEEFFIFFQRSNRNQGGTMINDQLNQKCHQSHSSCISTTKTILLDDLLEVVPFKRAIMKIDIEHLNTRPLTWPTNCYTTLM